MFTNEISRDEFLAHWQGRFFTIFTGQALSLFGSALVQFALVWYLTRQTGSATILATATIIGILPQVILGPFTGALVDRWNRRAVMILADSAIALTTLVLVILFYLDIVQVWHIYVILFLRSLGSSFHYPAMSASTSLMVPEGQLSRVAGMRQTLNGLLGIVAPPTGALLISIMKTEWVLSIDIITAALAVLPLFFISIPQPQKIQTEEQKHANTYWQDVKGGISYVTAWPGLLAILLVAAFLNFLLTPMGSLMPLLITRHFKLGALEFGLTDSVWGIGMIVGGLIISAWGGFSRRVLTSLLGVIGLGLGVITIGLAPSNMFWLALAGMGLIGFMNPIVNSPLTAIMQANVQSDMQGRVMSLDGSLSMAMTPLSLAIAGPLSDQFGLQTWYLAGGTITILVAIISLFIPAIMNIENNRK